MNGLIQLILQLYKEVKQKSKLANAGVGQKVVKTKKEYIVNIRRGNEELPINTEPISKDILVLPTDSILTFNYFVSNNLNIVYPYLLRKMTAAVKNNIKALELFQLGQTNNVMRIEKQEFEKYLLEMQMYFAEQENFEKAGTCTKLLDAHRVNLFLDSN